MNLNEIEFDNFKEEYAAIHILDILRTRKTLTVSGVSQYAFFDMVERDQVAGLLAIMEYHRLVRFNVDAYTITDTGYAFLRHYHETDDHSSLTDRLNGLSGGWDGVIFETADGLCTLVTRVPNNSRAWVFWSTYPVERKEVDAQIQRLESERGIGRLTIREMNAPERAFQY